MSGTISVADETVGYFFDEDNSLLSSMVGDFLTWLVFVPVVIFILFWMYLIAMNYFIISLVGITISVIIGGIISLSLRR